jgi:hypothetical protein
MRASRIPDLHMETDRSSPEEEQERHNQPEAHDEDPQRAARETGGDLGAQHATEKVGRCAYRLSRVSQLTGHHVSQSDQRFTLHAAVLGARLLDWPNSPLPTNP